MIDALVDGLMDVWREGFWMNRLMDDCVIEHSFKTCPTTTIVYHTPDYSAEKDLSAEETRKAEIKSVIIECLMG